VSADSVEYNELPWKFSAGTPNILGVIVSAQALRFAVDLVGAAGRPGFFRTSGQLPQAAISTTMDAIGDHTRSLTELALRALAAVPGLTVYGPAEARRRSPLVAFNVAGWNPFELAEALNEVGVESRAGCHCATLAHRELRLEPAASCRLSFYLYNTIDDVDRAVSAVREIVAPVGRHRHRSTFLGSSGTERPVADLTGGTVARAG
jgi:cysteine desulfurase/selenocysteine lyase